MTAVAKRTTDRIVRPIKVLVPLIQDELEAGNKAGLEHYRRAGEMLLEAREQVVSRQWTAWLSKNFDLSPRTAGRYMVLARHAEIGERAETGSLSAAIGERLSEHRQRTGPWRPIREFTASVPGARLSQERQTVEDEVRLHRDLALQLVDIGYKALATRLHPDHGGSKEAMTRLNRVRDELKAVAETRRFL
jgi:hypothetical protein